MPINKWEGDAIDIAQANTVTLGGVWLATETLILTISDKQLILTIGTAVTIPDILDNLLVMVNGSGTFGAGYSSNALGTTIGEFSEITAEEDGATVLTLTANSSGKPFTLVSSETSAAGTVADATPTANSSKNDWNNQNNWSLNLVPIAAHDVLAEDNDIPILYGLDQSLVAHNSITFRQSYTGDIGLPETNSDGIPYAEYRGTFLQTASAAIEIGQGEGTGSGRIKIDSGSTTPVVIDCRNTGSPTNTNQGALIWKGTGAVVDITSKIGSIGLGVIDGAPANVRIHVVVDATILHYNGNVSDLVVDGSGTVDCDVPITNKLQMKGPGEVTTKSTLPVGPVNGVIVEAGTVNCLSSGTLQTLKIFNGGVFDNSLNPNVLTVDDKAELSIGSTLLDPLGRMVFTNGWTVPGGSLTAITLDLGKDRTQYDVS